MDDDIELLTQQCQQFGSALAMIETLRPDVNR